MVEVSFLTNFQGRGNLLKTPTDAESNSNSATGSESQSPSSESAPTKPQRPFTLQVFCFSFNFFSVSLLSRASPSSA
jgi:hypothetical protein